MVISMFYINLFFIYSFLGHILEKILYPDHASGILYGFWTPIYGIGAVIIVMTYKFLEKRLKLNKWTKAICTFLIGALFLSFIEFLGGTLIESIFNITFWDYSNMKFNFGKYASLEMSLVWGISSLVLIYIIEPFLKKIAIKIPKWVTIALSTLFIIDIIISLLLRANL